MWDVVVPAMWDVVVPAMWDDFVMNAETRTVGGGRHTRWA
jgi:hypothetical protein